MDERKDRQAEVRGTAVRGAWGKPGPVRREPAHDITRIDETPEGVRIHVETPPVEPDAVTVDATGDVIDIILPLGEERSVFCSVDVPLGYDATRMSHTVLPGHLEIFLPRA